MKKLKKILFVLLALCFSITIYEGIVFAASTQCVQKNVTLCGYTYSYCCGVELKDNYVRAYVTVDSPNKVPFPTGYFGLKARLYNDSGSIVSEGAWTYNMDSNLLGMTVRDAVSKESGTFYSKAQVKFYNGNGYNTYNCNTSPYMQRCATIMAEEYKVNENGQTYGSDYYAESIEDLPDLISVVGNNGIEGYVYATELERDIFNLEDVLNYIENGNNSYTIPVYLSDGSTLVDYFTISELEYESVVASEYIDE